MTGLESKNCGEPSILRESDSAARTIRTENGGERRCPKVSVLQGARYAEFKFKVSFLGVFIRDQ